MFSRFLFCYIFGRGGYCPLVEIEPRTLSMLAKHATSELQT